MAFKDQNQQDAFHKGRGDVSASLAKSGDEVISEGAETMDDVFPSQDGASADDHGGCPIYATGETPNHSGRGLGRGHGPETAKNA